MENLEESKKTRGSSLRELKKSSCGSTSGLNGLNIHMCVLASL